MFVALVPVFAFLTSMLVAHAPRAWRDCLVHHRADGGNLLAMLAFGVFAAGGLAIYVSRALAAPPDTRES